MLDRIKKEPARAVSHGFDWGCMTGTERHLIDLYRQMSEQEQRQLRRLFEVLATNPDDSDDVDFPDA
jgi:hypothetical protein